MKGCKITHKYEEKKLFLKIFKGPDVLFVGKKSCPDYPQLLAGRVRRFVRGSTLVSGIQS
jgi:hypothetical protein